MEIIRLCLIGVVGIIVIIIMVSMFATLFQLGGLLFGKGENLGNWLKVFVKSLVVILILGFALIYADIDIEGLEEDVVYGIFTVMMIIIVCGSIQSLIKWILDWIFDSIQEENKD